MIMSLIVLAEQTVVLRKELELNLLLYYLR